MFRLLGLTVLSTAMLAASGAARADVFYWQDPESGASLTFPDRWAQVSNQNPGDVLTVRAPGGNDFAECRLNVQPDGRFKIYPAEYSPQIQRKNISRDFWDGAFALYNNVNIDQVSDNAGLGRGFGSWATASYETAKGARMIKRSLAYASYYDRHVYTLECSAEAAAYDRWVNPFLSVVKSVNFKKTSNGQTTGYYRDFLSDKTLKIRGATVLDDTYH
jgi:hypothetical protein